MKAPYLVVIGLLVLSGSLLAQNKSVETPITLEELHRRQLLGQLGLPLGTVATIDAVVTSGDETRVKAYQGLYLLTVTHVNGQPLEKPPLMRFVVDSLSSTVNLPHDKPPLLFGAKQEGGNPTASQKEIEKEYVGKTHRLVVYESGGYAGIPDNLPKGVPLAGAAGFKFGFSTSLTVLAEADNVIQDHIKQ
ncbi:hypothetical protein [Planctopirus hydrillae]|uniref:Uncharacterized protein n=1 Tax=Planctopirus hydrillae TaxID=1841610 RepID=A0A1C3ECJ5_9PLAN|nr:hypothetical protein [Planctopirus hydrillae]ODA30977.1 hypothetical protein A6X21_23280 [Planctopirus hydrillae]